jgi:hypothetical protein
VSQTKHYLVETKANAKTSVTATKKNLTVAKDDAITSVEEDKDYLIAMDAEIEDLLDIGYGKALDSDKVNTVDVVENLPANPPTSAGVTGYESVRKEDAVVDVQLEEIEDEGGDAEGGDDNANA